MVYLTLQNSKGYVVVKKLYRLEFGIVLDSCVNQDGLGELPPEKVSVNQVQRVHGQERVF